MPYFGFILLALESSTTFITGKFTLIPKWASCGTTYNPLVACENNYLAAYFLGKRPRLYTDVFKTIPTQRNLSGPTEIRRLP